MKSTSLAALVASLFITGTAFAQSAPAAAPSPERAARMQQRIDMHFAKIDKNGDGTIAREEAAAHKMLANNFDAIDSNKDGKLSKEELHQFQTEFRTKKHEELIVKFKTADKNGDGGLSREEVATTNMPRVAKNFDAIDANKDGKLTQEELKKFHAESRGKKREEFIAKFKTSDKNGDGALSKDEVAAANMPRIAKNFDAIDTNQDGKITQEELHAFMSHLRNEHAAAK